MRNKKDWLRSILFLGENMEIIAFLEKIEQIVVNLDDIVQQIEENDKIDKNQINQLLEKVNQIMEIWVYFIRELRCEDEALLIEIYQDIAKSVLVDDRLRLVDAMLFGLRELLVEYYMVLKEAINEE